MIRGYESLKSNFQPLHQEVHAKKIQTHIIHPVVSCNVNISPSKEMSETIALHRGSKALRKTLERSQLPHTTCTLSIPFPVSIAQAIPNAPQTELHRLAAGSKAKEKRER